MTMPDVTNWKTTTAGVAMILSGIADLLHQIATGTPDGTRLIADWTAVIGGIGLVLAKDHDK
jgi:hypothetical protein